MSQYMNLPAAYDIINKLIPSDSKTEQSYYDILYKISTAVWEKRINDNMSQTQFAKVLGVSQAMISKYESGDYNFTIHQICKLCEQLDLSLEFDVHSHPSRLITYEDQELNIPVNYEILGDAA